MAHAVKFSEIEAQINQLHQGVSKIASWYRTNADHYTPEGIKAKYAAAIQDRRYNYQDKAQQLAHLVDNLVPAAQAQAAKTRSEVMPSAKDATEQLAAEMRAQRLLARPGLKPNDIADLIRESEPSPGLTLAVEEWQARGMLPEELAEAALTEKSPAYREAQTNSTRAHQMAGFLRQRLAKTTEQMETTAPVETQYVPSVDAALKLGWADSVNVDDVPADAFGDIPVDPVYRDA